MPTPIKLSDALALKAVLAKPSEDEASVLAAFEKHRLALESALAWHTAERDRKLAELAEFRAQQAQVAVDVGVSLPDVDSVDVKKAELVTRAEVEAKRAAAEAAALEAKAAAEAAALEAKAAAEAAALEAKAAAEAAALEAKAPEKG